MASSLSTSAPVLTARPDSRPVFNTSGFIAGPRFVVEVSHMLLDSGSSISFISPDLANIVGLAVQDCATTEVSTINGITTADKFAEFNLYMAGVEKRITAYIKDVGEDVLLGMPVLHVFGASSFHASGRWSIACPIVDIHYRYVLPRSNNDISPTRTVHDRDAGLERAMQPGETSRDVRWREAEERRRGLPTGALLHQQWWVR